jgi:hypothetical protein
MLFWDSSFMAISLSFLPLGVDRAVAQPQAGGDILQIAISDAVRCLMLCPASLDCAVAG